MTRLSVPRYDLFKLLVSIVLVIILILLLLREGATTPAATLPSENGLPATANPSLASSAPSEASDGARAVEAISPSLSVTLKADTLTPAAAAMTPASGLTSTQVSTNVASTSAPAAGETSSCNTRLPSRLNLGQQARVAQRLNLRIAPSIDAPILLTNAVDTTVEIIGGPVCTPVGERAYVWWQVRLGDGAEGWSAETQLNEPAYLLQPVP